MKRLYTLALSALVLAASATVAVPTAKFAKSRNSELRSERVEKKQFAVAPIETNKAVKHNDIAARAINIDRSVKAVNCERMTKNVTSEIETLNNTSLTSKPTKVKAKAASSPANYDELTALQFEMSYKGMLNSNSGTHTGNAYFEYNATDDQLYLVVPDYGNKLLVQYDFDGNSLIFYSSVNYGTNSQGYKMSLEVLTNTGAQTNAGATVPFDAATGKFTFPTGFTLGMLALNPTTDAHEGYFWAATEFNMAVVDGDYSISLTHGDVCTSDNKFTLTATAGADVAFLKYLVLDFQGAADKYSTYIASLGQNMVANQEYTIDPVNGNYSGNAMTESGYTSVLIGAYDSDGNLKKAVEQTFIVVLEDEEGWKNVGEVDYTDQLFAQYYNNFSHTQKAMLQAKEDQAGYYRLVNPYSERAGLHDAACPHHYLLMNIADPEWVEIPFSVSGLDLAGDGILSFGTCAALGYDKATAQSRNIVSGTLNGQTVTFPVKSIYCHEQYYNEPGSWYYMNGNSAVTFTFPDVNLNMTVVDTNNAPVKGATVALGDVTATTDSVGKATVKVPFETGYFATVKPVVNGKEFEVTLTGAETEFTATVEAVEAPEPTVVEFTAADFTFSGSDVSASKDGFYLGFSKDSGNNNPAKNGDNIRLYASGTMTIGATQITKVVITLASDAAAQYGDFTPSVGAYTAPQAAGDTVLTWEGDAASVVFTAAAKANLSTSTNRACQIRIAKVTVYGTPGDGKAPATPAVEVANIKAFLDAANKTKNTTITGEVTVTYQNGKYMFVTDATGSLEVYGEVGKTYTNGTKLTGITGKYGEYGKMPQLVPVADSFTAGTEGDAVAPVEYDADSVQIAQYVVMTDVAITKNENKYYVGDVQLYERFDLEDLELKEAEKATVTGIYAIYNSTKELFVISVDYDEQGGDDPMPPTPGEGVTVADVVGDYEVSYTVELEGADDYDGEMTVVAGEGENALVFNFPFDFYGEYLWNLKATLEPATGNITFKLADQQTPLEAATCKFQHWDNAAGGWTDVTEIVANYNGQTVVFDEDDAFALEAESGSYYTLFDMIEMTKVDPNADPNEGWKSLGNAKLMDGWVLSGIGINQAENIYEVELQQNETNENLYRLVDPYHGNSPAAQYNECEKIGYIEFDVTDPDNVLFSNIKAGFGNSEMELTNIYCYDEMSFWCNTLGTTPAETNELLVANDYDPVKGSTYKNGVVTVNGTLFGISASDGGYSWQDENGNPTNMDAAIWFPGFSPELDSIKEVNSADDSSKVYYNLRGQRISKPTTAGIYILNNQKVYVK